MTFRRLLAGTAAAVIASVGLVACGSGSSGETVRIGTTDAQLKEWDVFADIVEAEGIDIEIVPFSDYNTPNDALVQGEIDVNKFQHLDFLASYNKGANADLVPYAATEINPLSLFWKDHDSLDGIEGEGVVIPNDDTNQGRAINVLAQAGLVTLRDDSVYNPTPADVDTEKSKVSIVTVDAAQTTTAYHEGRPAIINNSFLERASIDPSLAIFQDDPSTEQAEPYINAWVTTRDKADDETLIHLAELWKDPAVTAAVLETSGNTAVTVERSPEELAAIMERLAAREQ